MVLVTGERKKRLREVIEWGGPGARAEPVGLNLSERMKSTLGKSTKSCPDYWFRTERVEN